MIDNSIEGNMLYIHTDGWAENRVPQENASQTAVPRFEPPTIVNAVSMHLPG
jgi:hypothetical protein